MDWRLIIDEPACGTWNMALDQSLLQAAGRAGQGGGLRFYRWSAPTLSLGYFQRHADRAEHTSSVQCPMVRRTTGGGAILHDRELTYSITLPVANHVSGGLRAFYDILHGTLIEQLAAFGVTATRYSPACEENQSQTAEPFLCFMRRCCGDVLVEGMKVAGSAQYRHRGAFLQHGSVLLARSTAAPELPGILELAGRDIDPCELATRWAERASVRLGAVLHASSPSEEEIRYAKLIQDKKFGYDQWTYRR